VSEEIALAAADLALVQRLTRERDALAIQVRALSDQAADLQADRGHWTLAARRAEQAKAAAIRLAAACERERDLAQKLANDAEQRARGWLSKSCWPCAPS